MAKVLIVDDEQDVLKVLKARVESKGYQVVTAVDGVKALEILKTEIPDLIISDVLMPVMDGFQLYKELKQNPKTAKIPVLILTARGKMEDTFRVIGVDEFISKPFVTEDFLKKVSKLIDLKTAVVEKASIPTASPSQDTAPSKIVTQTNKGVRVLVTGFNKEIVNKIVQLFKKSGIAAEFAFVGTDIISKNKAFQPSLIFLDILHEDIPADEIVGKLRHSAGPDKTAIILYSITSDNPGDDNQQRIMSIDVMKSNCLAVGATEYVGSFNERTFMTSVSRFLK